MVAAAPRSVTSPGRCRGRINYDRDETVVDTPVSDEVKRARQETLNNYSVDILGVKGPRWQGSVTVSNSKYTRPFSDGKLGNTLSVSLINSKDSRTLLGATCSYDNVHDHAFTRGDVTTDWNHSTALNQRELRESFDKVHSTALTATAKKRQGLQQYRSPVERELSFAQEQREAKQRAARERKELVDKYGAEGAEIMLQAASMPKPVRRPQLKATKDDLIAVAQLPFSEDLAAEDTS